MNLIFGRMLSVPLVPGAIVLIHDVRPFVWAGEISCGTTLKCITGPYNPQDSIPSTWQIYGRVNVLIPCRLSGSIYIERNHGSSEHSLDCSLLEQRLGSTRISSSPTSNQSVHLRKPYSLHRIVCTWTGSVLWVVCVLSVLCCLCGVCAVF